MLDTVQLFLCLKKALFASLASDLKLPTTPVVPGMQGNERGVLLGRQRIG